MAALGVQHYKVNPTHWPFEKRMEKAKEIGLAAAGYLENWELGPYCETDICEVPFGVDVGNNKTPVSVVVALGDGRVTEIDVLFSQDNWSELIPIIRNKYGPRWRVEREPFVTFDAASNESTTAERVTLLHSGGRNARSGDKCQIWVSNYDMHYVHHDPLGPSQSILVIKLISRNF